MVVKYMCWLEMYGDEENFDRRLIAGLMRCMVVDVRGIGRLWVFCGEDDDDVRWMMRMMMMRMMMSR